MNSYTLKETAKFPNFYEIPGYSNYCVSREGRVLNKKNQQFLLGSENPAGYINYRITGDNGKVFTWGRHRLLCYVFKNPNKDIKNIVVNHLNGIKGDDRLSNLEWVTYQENAEHAGLIGLTEKCCPISVRDVDTGEVMDFPSIVECARFSGCSKDTINYRVKIGERRVFPERKQYRVYQPNTPWYIPKSIESALLHNSTSKSVSIKNVISGEITHFDKISELCLTIGVKPSTITYWLSRKDQPVLPCYIQIKWKHDDTPWREVGDRYLELAEFTGVRPVLVTNSITGDKKIYQTCAECAMDNDLTETALSYRLKTNGLVVFKDNCCYEYYSNQSKY